MPRPQADLLGEGVDGRTRRHDHRVVVVEQLHRPAGDGTLGLAVDIVLHMHVEVRDMGIGRTRAAVDLVKEALAFENLHVLADRDLRHTQFVGDIRNTHEPAPVQRVENVFVPFGDTQHNNSYLVIFHSELLPRGVRPPTPRNRTRRPSRPTSAEKPPYPRRPSPECRHRPSSSRSAAPHSPIPRPRRASRRSRTAP